jgi:hypothetical protein
MIQAEEFTTGNACSYHYHDDGNGNVVEITNVSASMAASYRYDAFGRIFAKSNSCADSNRYCICPGRPRGACKTTPLLWFHSMSESFRFYVVLYWNSSLR